MGKWVDSFVLDQTIHINIQTMAKSIGMAIRMTVINFKLGTEMIPVPAAVCLCHLCHDEHHQDGSKDTSSCHDHDRRLVLVYRGSGAQLWLQELFLCLDSLKWTWKFTSFQKTQTLYCTWTSYAQHNWQWDYVIWWSYVGHRMAK